MRGRQLVGATVVLGVIAATILACVAHQLIPCGDELCPTSSVCTAGGCASPEAAVACEGLADGAACSTPTFAAGTCAGGACYPISCGNAIVDQGELCDDGNASDGDGCSRDCRSTEVCGNQMVDLAVGEQCDLGTAGLSSDGCSSRCAVEFDLWRDISTNGPSTRIHAPFVPDPNGRLMLIGGSLGSGASGQGALSDVLEWDGLTWRMARTITPLPAITRAAAAYDSVRRRVVLFGGRLASGVDSDRTWEYDGVTWTDRSPATGPSARTSTRLSFDPVRQRVVLFGGELAGVAPGSPSLLGDTWEWNGAAGTWTELAVQGPEPRELAGMSYDPNTQTTLLVGGGGVGGANVGVGSGSGSDAETWTWDGAAWSQVSTVGAPPQGPGSLAHEPIDDSMLLLTTGNQAWRYTGTTWTQITSTINPSGELGGLAKYPNRDLLAVHKPSGVHEWGGGSSWTAAASPQQAPVTADRMAYDVARGRLVAAGQTTGMWEWDGYAWERRATSVLAGAALAYDSTRNVTLQFGGQFGNVSVNDFSRWDGTMLMPILTPLPPSPRRDHRMAFDTKRGRLVLFGGVVGGSPSSETWIWDGTAWTNPAVAPPPPPARFVHSLAYDPERDRVVLFGGNGNSAGVPTYLDDTWEWNGETSTWTRLTPTLRPAARAGHLLTYDPRRQRVVLAGGNGTAGPFADTWEWDGTTWSERTTIVPIPNGTFASSIDVNGDIVTVTSNRTWRLRFESNVRADQCANIDTDGDGLVGCADPDCWGHCAPSCLLGPCNLAAPRCGDGVCNLLIENYAMCPGDCPPL